MTGALLIALWKWRSVKAGMGRVSGPLVFEDVEVDEEGVVAPGGDSDEVSWVEMMLSFGTGQSSLGWLS